MAYHIIVLVQRLHLYAFDLFNDEEKMDQEQSYNGKPRIRHIVLDHGILAWRNLVLYRLWYFPRLRYDHQRCMAEIQEEASSTDSKQQIY